MKRIMILGASILQLPAIRKAQEMGLEVVAVDMDPNAVGFLERDIIREVVSTIDIPTVIEAAKRWQIDGVMTLASDMPMRTVAAVAQELELPGITVETALCVTDKGRMRLCLKDHGVPVPAFYRVESLEEFFHVAGKFQCPFIVKPPDNSGSRGICLLERTADQEELEAAYNYSRRSSRSGMVLLEEYMRGQEVSVETLSVGGKTEIVQITDKITTGPPHFVELGHTQPSGLPQNVLMEIEQTARAAVEAVGIVDGPSHTEIMVTAEGPKVVELGARLGGDCITTHLVPLSTGVDMVEACIQIAMGFPIKQQPHRESTSAIRYLAPQPGRITGISGVEETRRMPGVVEVQIFRGIGDLVPMVESSTDRMGYVIAQGKGNLSGAEICEAALKMIQVNVEQPAV